MHVVENKERLKYAMSTGIKWPIARPFPPSSGVAYGRFKTQNPALRTGILNPPLVKAARAKAQSRGTYSPSPPRRRGSSLDSRLRGNDGRCYFHAFTARLKPGPDTRRFGVPRLAAAFAGQGLPCSAPKVESRCGTPSPSPLRRRGQEADGLNQVLYPESPSRRRGSSLDSRLRGNDGRYCLHAFAARLKPGPDTKRFGVRRLAAAFPGQGLPCRDTRRLEALHARACKFSHENEPKVIDNKADHKKRTQERTQSG